MTTCSTCGQEKAEEEFRVRTDTGRRRGECRDCAASYGEAYRAENKTAIRASKSAYASENKDAIAARFRPWYHRNKERVRDGVLRRVYGVTLAEKTAMLAAQGDRCAICRTDEPGGHGWNLDHDHATKMPRGILCHGCNTALGGFGDSVDTLRAAIEYLKPEPLRLVAG